MARQLALPRTWPGSLTNAIIGPKDMPDVDVILIESPQPALRLVL